METLTKETDMLMFVRETVLTLKQVNILKSRGFKVCFKEVNEWDQDIYLIYA